MTRVARVAFYRLWSCVLTGFSLQGGHLPDRFDFRFPLRIRPRRRWQCPRPGILRCGVPPHLHGCVSQGALPIRHTVQLDRTDTFILTVGMVGVDSAPRRLVRIARQRPARRPLRTKAQHSGSHHHLYPRRRSSDGRDERGLPLRRSRCRRFLGRRFDSHWTHVHRRGTSSFS